MAEDVYLAFGAETSGLEAGLARAQAEVRRTAAEMRSLAAEMASTGASSDSALGSRLVDLGSKLADAKEHVSGFKEELRGVGSEGGGFFASIASGVESFLSPITAAKEAIGGIGEALVAAFAVEKIAEFVKQMAELGEQVTRTSKILGLTPQQVGELNFALSMSGVKLEDVEKALVRFQVGLEKAASTGTGPVAEGLHVLGLNAAELVGMPLPEQLEKIADAVAKFPDSTTKTAAIQALGRGFIEMLPLLDQGGSAIADFMAQYDKLNPTLNTSVPLLKEMSDNLTTMGAALEGAAVAGFMQFSDAVNGAMQVLTDLATAFTDSINQGGLFKVVLDQLGLALRLLVTGVAILIAGLKDLWTVAADGAASMRDELLGLANQLGSFMKDALTGSWSFPTFRAAAAETTAKVKADFVDMGKSLQAEGVQFEAEWKKIWAGFGESAEEAAARAKEAVHGATVTAGIGGATGKVGAIDTSPLGQAKTAVENLTAALQATTDALAGKKGLSYGLSDSDRDRIIRTIAGEADSGNAKSQEAVADVIRNRLLSPKGEYGEGVMSVTRADQFAAWNPSDPNFARISGMSPDSAAYKQIGDVVDKVFSGAAPDITHGASNYYAPAGMPGGRPPSWAAGTEAENFVQVGTQRFSGRVAGLPEAPTGAPPTGEEQQRLLDLQKQQTLELEKAKQKVLDINTEEAGGTATAKAKLDIAEQDAKQKGDAVDNAKKLQAAAEADLAAAEKAGATQERIAKLKEEVAKTTSAVTAAESKQAESSARLDAAKAKESGDVEKEKAAELALADIKIKAAGSDVTARQTAEAEKIAIETRYADQSKSMALQKGEEEIAAARKTAQDKIKDYELEFRAKQISESQKVALTKAALAEEIAQEKSIYQQELALDNLRPAERQKVLAQLAAAETQYAQQVKETQLKAAEDSAKAWQGMADKVASVLNSQVSGIISGTTTVKQAFSNMAKGIIEDVVKYAVKWAVEHAFAATQVMAINNTVVASTLAGDAAKTASATTSSAAGIGAQAANAMQSIAIDAAKVFGGVFGFLAPFLGPFAAGPAAGMQATVLATGSAFDTGAWELPKDMIAGVHRGEMIIPSRGGIADEFRSFISAGGLNPQGGATAGASAMTTRSVNVNPSTHFHVSAMDQQSVAQFFQGNHRAIVSAVDRAVRHGSALGLRSFTP